MLFFSFIFSLLLTCTALDTINTNQPLRDGQSIVSEHGEFEMGFFSTPGLPGNRYFGIWYKKISNGTVVWVANRDNPVTNTSGIVRVTTSKGIVVLVNGTIIWSSNSSRSVNNPIAQLQDTGNLVFRDKNDDGPENIVWQSFDHPQDNFLPGMKLGIDLVTGMQRYFTSWKSADDPSTGSFIYRIDANGYPQLLLWRGSKLTYRTGPWVGIGFSGFPKQEQTEIYTPKYVISPKEIYYESELVSSSDSVLTRLILTPDGHVQRLIWNKQKHEWSLYLSFEVNDCDTYKFCGGNGVCNINNSPRCECMRGFHPNIQENWAAADWSGGCARNTQLDCKKGDGFIKVLGIKLPDTRLSWYNLTLNLHECRSLCLNNCSCRAYSNADFRGGGSGCLLWFGTLDDIRGYSDDGQDLYVRMAASDSENTEGNKSSSTNRVVVIVIPVLAAMGVILVLFLLYAFRKRKLKRKGIVRLNSDGVATNRIGKNEFDLPLFTFVQIAKATNDFSFNNKLGEGGFGPVYKGMLDKGQEIAVKRLSETSRQGIDEFMNEVSIIAKLQHRNLVKLLGCCVEEGERMLIYEYMPNRGLDSIIFDEELCKSFDWLKRYNIINGIARGLLYLHEDSRLRIIHRDLKVSNILLDHEMNPKISDFGMARIFGGSETEASTTRVVGTYGYMPPEYAIEGLFSTKSDVYSFGVLVLEIVSGKKNRGFKHPDHNHNLLGHAWRRYNEKDRPSMSSVVLMLSSKIELPVPKEPGFYSERNPEQNNHSSSSKCESETINQISITYLAPR
ncbi:Receptor-like serine/threonine-protein kinase [Heracleum sosnowskyi]|uniref:Receptor-like serine/threonine-protein kinase n=1 Tax=Heracleum sosnowskyi TaxID=360622 RepID=A0AAD8JIB2_9APIA|nr:Receptor-like serine/threonine-protein kinase [Heracleum sosnowskyi]